MLRRPYGIATTLTATAIAVVSLAAPNAPARAATTSPATSAVTASSIPGPQGTRCAVVNTARYRDGVKPYGGFCGRRMSNLEIAKTLRQAGWPRHLVAPMLGTVLAESGGWTHAYRHNRKPYTGVVSSTDRGLAQINDKHWPASRRINVYDPRANLRFAYREVYKRQGMRAWHGYRNRGQFTHEVNVTMRKAWTQSWW